MKNTRFGEICLSQTHYPRRTNIMPMFLSTLLHLTIFLSFVDNFRFRKLDFVSKDLGKKNPKPVSKKEEFF